MVPGLIPRPVVTAIAAVVIGVWALSQVAEVFVPTYDAPAELHLTVMAVLGALFAVGKTDRPAEPAKPAPDDAPALPPGRVSAADLIARLAQERRGG